MFDFLVKNASLPDGKEGIDVACKNGLITSVEKNISGEAKETIYANGWLLAPPFVDPHFHMDATLSLGTPRLNKSGTLLEGISLWGELKPVQTIDDIIARSLKYCDLAVSMGIGAIRSHVDTCDDELKGVQALLEVKKQVKDYLELQLGGFSSRWALSRSYSIGKYRSRFGYGGRYCWRYTSLRTNLCRKVHNQLKLFVK
jgi:cytosine deaminase